MEARFLRFALAAFLLTFASTQEQDVDPIPVPRGNYAFFEPFASRQDFDNRWVLSAAKKEGAEEEVAKYDGEWSIESPDESGLTGDLGLVLKSKAKHHGVSVRLERPFEFRTDPFIVQYEIKFQEGQECGGAYIKLLSHSDSLDLENFTDKTPYTIMFGPDKCGETDKVHFIFRHKDPKTGELEEKHSKHTSGGEYINDKKTHVYTLIVSPDNTYEILIDHEVKTSGSLLSDEDFKPPVNPPSEIDDPDDSKPDDWDERQKIPDPEATKPDDWDEDAPAKIPDPDATKPDEWNEDEPEYIDDPDASKPSDWVEDEDGEWEAPQIPNPKCDETGCGPWTPPVISNPAYKGKWKPPMIDNPNYKGKWKPRRIANPDFFEDKNPFQMTSIGAIGLELWSMSNNIYFDNFLITSDRSVATQVANDSWKKKAAKEGGSVASGMVDSLVEATHERPWLWGFYALALVLPFVLIAACCCRVKKDETGEAKKTDEPQPDDPHKDDEEAKEEVVKEEGDGDDQPEGDEKSEDKEGSEEGKEEIGEKEDKDKDKDVVGEDEIDTTASGIPEEIESEPLSGDKPADADADEEEEEEEEEEPLRRSPRKRKPRKET